MENSKWYDKKGLVILLLIIFFPVGLYALWKNSAFSKGTKIALTSVIALFVIIGMSNDDKQGSAKSSSSEANSESSVEEEKVIGIGDVLKTDYFDVTVNEVSIQDRVNTGNEFADLNPENGNVYFILNTTFKNTDSESRMLTDGTLWIEYNGKEYEFDKAETVMLEGWGLLLDQINPLTSKTTNLVYKIPAEIKGPVSYTPGRADSDERIFLGSIQ